MTPKILYQDDCLLVIDKPAGLVVDCAETTREETLEDILKNSYGLNLERSGIVHRLDKDTSGILLVAKTPEALENLQKQFKERAVKKEYLVLVHGWVEEKGRVDVAIARNPKNREKFIVVRPTRSDAWDLVGRYAVTEYEPVGKCQMSNVKCQMLFPDFNKIQMRKLERQHYGEFTLLVCKPKTGRTHQIRVHLKYIGSPIVSDEKYAGRKMNRLDKRWCPRMFLHAAKIGFRHPVSEEWMELESPLSEDLEKAFQQLSS